MNIRIDDLHDPSLTIEEKNGFLEGVVERIDVKNLDNQTHELKIGSPFPYVGDTLVKYQQTSNITFSIRCNIKTGEP